MNINPETGEVTGPIDEPGWVAREYVRVAGLLTDARAEAQQLQAALDGLAAEVRRHLQDSPRLDGGGAWVVAVPGRAPNRTVDRVAAAACAEQLETLGLGRWETTFRAPTAADLKKHAGAVIAAGLPFDRLLPAAAPAPTVLEIVDKETS